MRENSILYSSLVQVSGDPERRNRVVSNPALYSGGPWFKSLSGDPAIMTCVFCGFPQFLQAKVPAVRSQ
jgi:hypothetical protein